MITIIIYLLEYFQKNHQFYQEQVVPVLQIILSSTQAMDVQLLQYCSDLESETNFYKVLDSLEHILRIQDGRCVFFSTILFKIG